MLIHPAKSISSTLTGAFLIICICSIIIAGIFQITIHSRAQQKSVVDNQQLVAQNAARAVVGFIHEKFSIMETAVFMGKWDIIHRKPTKSVLESMLGRDNSFRHIVCLDDGGQLIAVVSRQSRMLSEKYQERIDTRIIDYLKAAPRYVSPVVIDEETYEPLVTLGVPIKNLLGDFKGVLLTQLNLKFIWNLVEELKIGQTGQSYVVNRNGNLIASKDISRVIRGENKADIEKVKEFIHLNADNGVAPPSSYKGIEGSRVVGTFVALGTPDWAVVTELPMYEAYRDVIYNILASIGIVCLVAGLSVWIGIIMARRLASPLMSLTRTASDIAKGNLELVAPVEGPKETAALAESFNNMTQQLNFMLSSEEERSSQLKKEIVQRKAAEQEALYLKNLMSNVINSMPSVLVGVDREGRVTQWNRTAEQYTGIKGDKARGKLLSDAFPKMAVTMEKIFESIRTKQSIHQRKQPGKLTGDPGYEDITIYPLTSNGSEGAVIRIDDVTEKVRLEEMMIQSEKMLSVGGLAAGMAHEINNPLAGIMQTSQVMGNRLGQGRTIPANEDAAKKAGTTMDAIGRFMQARQIPRMIDSIQEAGRRLAEIVDNMLSFARKSDAIMSSYALEDLLDKTLELASTDYDLKKEYDFKLIHIRKEYGDNLPLVPCEKAKIQQVLLNIFRNGAQAMQGAKTKNPEFILRTRFDEKDSMACLEIEDNGPGMKESVSRRIFEPFFTTKPVGVGTGLGLSVSFFIITENHGGQMTVESQPGAGARFIIRLPANC